MKVEVAVLGSLSLIVLMVSVDVKQYLKKYPGNCETIDRCTNSCSLLPALQGWIHFLLSKT